MSRRVVFFECERCKELYLRETDMQRCEDMHVKLHASLSVLPKGTVLTPVDKQNTDLLIVEQVTTMVVADKPMIKLLVSSMSLDMLTNLAAVPSSVEFLQPLRQPCVDEEYVRYVFTEFAMTGIFGYWNLRLCTKDEQEHSLQLAHAQAALIAKLTGALTKTRVMPIASIDTTYLTDKDQPPC